MAKASAADIRAAILRTLPEDGSTIGNGRMRELIAAELDADLTEADYFAVRDALVADGRVATGKGRGGSIRRVLEAGAALTLQAQQVPEAANAPKPSQGAMTLAQARRAKAEVQGRKSEDDAKVIAYQHDHKRRNNPDVGVVTPETDPDQPRTTWAWDPHIDPALQFDMGRAQVEQLIDDALASGDDATMRAALEQLRRQAAPYLNWTGKAERSSFEVDTVSLHVHERIDPASILSAVRKAMKGEGRSKGMDKALQPGLFDAPFENLIDDALASGDVAVMRTALEQLKRQAAPYLNWTGKAERTSFEVDTVSLHVHERIDPATILGAVQKRLKQGKGEYGSQQDWLRAWFETPLPYREAIEFYKHDRGWANRLIAGDSLLVMNSLLQKEGMAGQVQMIYIDPPYGIKYGSNFQPFVNKRDVKDRKDEDLTQEPEMIKAFRDTWELGIHSYLTYLRDRLLLARELLSESGSVFVQISDENVGRIRSMLDELFGAENFCSEIIYRKTTGKASVLLDSTCDYILWYAKNRKLVTYRRLNTGRDLADEDSISLVRAPDGSWRSMDKPEIYAGRPRGPGKVFFPHPLTSARASTAADVTRFVHQGLPFSPGLRTFSTDLSGLRHLARANRVHVIGATPRYVRYLDDFPHIPINNVWDDTRQSGFADTKVFVVQTSSKAVERCLLMTTDPGDLVLDPTCGSGTTAYVAEKWGRRWITCDTSRVAITLAKQRLMTASYDYYELKYPHEGLKGGFIYKTVPHVTLKSIANNPEIDEIHEAMHPAIVTALAQFNAALEGSGVRIPITEGARKGQSIVVGRPGKRGVSAETSSSSEQAADDFETLPSGERVAKHELLEWEVPFDWQGDWPSAARPAFDAFHAARQAMQARMDASIAAHADTEVLYDQPEVSKTKRRVSGPFTVEAVPSPMVLALDDTEPPREADVAIARSGQSSRHHQWRDELTRTGIRGKGGQILKLADLETLPDTRHLHCSGVVADSGERVVVSFGPEHAALEQRQVELALREASELFPRPKMIVFCAFAFDPEAAKDIDVLRGITALKAQMNTDLLTEDLKKARASNQSFWLMGQPDIELRPLQGGRYEVEVHGFDYFDTVKSELVSGGKGRIAAWALDTDYDERSLFPRQVFFPMAGAKDGWNKLKKDIKAELDESLLGRLHGTASLPFEAGDNRKVAVKIVDDRGIESLKILRL